MPPGFEPFLHAIAEEPDDDAPRLRDADWLDERGDAASQARAEFIRVQCALARVGDPPIWLGSVPTPSPIDWPADVRELRGRQRQLWEQHHHEWLAELPDCPGTSFRFHRGLVSCLEIEHSAGLVRAADRVFAVAPVSWVTFADCPPKAMSVLLDRVAAFDRVVRVSIVWRSPGSYDGREVAWTLASAGHLGRLRELHMPSKYVSDQGAEDLARAPFASRLTVLDLAYNEIEAGAEALLWALSPERLTFLDLSGNPIPRPLLREFRERFGQRVLYR